MTVSRQHYLSGLIVALLLLFGAVLPVAQAQQAQIDATTTGLNAAAAPAYGTTGPTDVFLIVGRIINILLGLLGLMIFIYVLWGGVMWMTAGGNTDKVADAQKKIYQAVIGTLIILSSFAISTFVINQLGVATNGPGSIQTDQNIWQQTTPAPSI